MRNILLPLMLLVSLAASAQRGSREYMPSPVAGSLWNTPGNLNPFIPGYFADPTIRKFGDTYYLYATTDGTGNGYGPAQVWVSKDFVNWKNVILNWPTTEVVWAPDVVQQADGTFRYYYCEPCNINVGESQSPLGPWHNILGRTDAQLVPDRYVHNVITLDPQLFRDDDGSEYLYFTTWGIYDGFGCGVAKLNPGYDGTNKTDARGWHEQAPHPIAADDFFSEKRLIPNTELKDIFEAPFVFKRNGIYYFTYSSGSCHTDTYRVQYATSTTGPMGPFEYRGEILTTNADGSVHGPGHHSVLQDGDNYYIVYHRHDIAKAIHGFNRQVCIDKLEFTPDGAIRPIVPTHDGVLPASLMKKSKQSPVNLAYGAKATASSTYSEQFQPRYAVDDNNATLWKARYCNNYTGKGTLQNEWLQIDLGEVKRFNQVWTQFEYATFFYQYHIDISLDGKNWTRYASRDDNTTAGSPMIDTGEAKARYVRMYVSDTQKNGHFPAIWNVKVFAASKRKDPRRLLPDTEDMDLSAVEKGYPRLHRKDVEVANRLEAYSRNYRVVDINADDYAQGKILNIGEIKNRCGGSFKGQGDVVVEVKKGKYAFYFDGEQSLMSDFPLPRTMTYNAPYTICAWVLNPEVGGIETVAEFTQRRNDLATIEFRQGTDRSNGLIAHNASFENFGAAEQCTKGQGEWQFWTVVYDGYMEQIYCDGRLVKEKNSFLMIRPEGNITLGSSFDGAHRFTGYIHSLQFFDKPLSRAEVLLAYKTPSDTNDRISFPNDGLQLRAEAITPDYIRMDVTNTEGQPVKTGLLNYNYSIGNGPKPNTRVCTAVVTDDEGNVVRTLTSTLAVDEGQFVIRRHAEPVRLSSASPDFNDNPVDNGARVLEEVEGDFVMQARVADFDGLSVRNCPAYNEAGIIAIEPDGGFVQNGVFPLYNCGNMLTQVKHGRPQFPVQNGWQFDPWIQLQRVGNQLYARRSADGKTWTDMPGSPMYVEGDTMRLGIYQTTYTANVSWAVVSDFVVYQKRN